MADVQARKEATLRRINGLKTSLARIVSSSNTSAHAAPRAPAAASYYEQRADSQRAGGVESPDRAVPHSQIAQDLTPHADPLMYLDHAQQEVERLTMERNQLMRTCANQERQLQQQHQEQVATRGALVACAPPADSSVQELVDSIERCYPALLTVDPPSEQGDSHVTSSLALSRLARVLPSLVTGSKLGDALSVAGVDLLERVDSLEGEVETDHYKLLDLVAQLTAVNERLNRESVIREAELQRAQESGTAAAPRSQDVVESLTTDRDASETRATAANIELAAALAQVRDQAEQLDRQAEQIAALSGALQRAQDDATHNEEALTTEVSRKDADLAVAQQEAEQLRTKLAVAEEQLEAATSSIPAAAVQDELDRLRGVCEAAERKAQSAQEENENLLQQLAALREAAHGPSSPHQSEKPPQPQHGDDSFMAASDLTRDCSAAGEPSYISVGGESQTDLSSLQQDDKRTNRRRASELVAVKRKVDHFRRQAEELEEKLQEAETQIRKLTADLERERMSSPAKPQAPHQSVEANDAAPTDADDDARSPVHRHVEPLLIDFAAMERAANTDAGMAGNALSTLYPSGVEVSEWMERLAAKTDFYTWAEQSLNEADNEAVRATGALYHVGLAVAAAADLWCDSEASRLAVARLLLQVQRFVDEPDRPGDDITPQDINARRHQNKVVEALRFCHVCLQRLPALAADVDDEDTVEARLAFFMAAVCQFVYTNGHHMAPDSSALSAPEAAARWKRVETLIEHVHRNNDAYPLFASEAAFERVMTGTRGLLTVSTGLLALALDVAFFPQERDGRREMWCAHRNAVGQAVLLLSQNACLFRRDGDRGTAAASEEDVDGNEGYGTDALAVNAVNAVNVLDNQDVTSLNSSLMGYTFSPTDALLAHMDAVVIPLAAALARTEPSLKPDLLTILASRGSLPFERNTQWHVPNTVLEPLVLSAAEDSPPVAIVPVDSTSFLKVNKELARLYRENVALRKIMLRGVTTTEALPSNNNPDRKTTEPSHLLRR